MNARREKWPLDYARQISALPTREARQQALAAVPAEWRDLVRETVQSGFAVRKARSGQVARVETG